MKRILVTIWLTALCFLLFSNAYAWDVPAYLRVDGGSRMWFSVLEGDLIQNDKTKLDLIQNLGIEQDKLVWEFFSSFRFDNIHVLRARVVPFTEYDGSQTGSSQRFMDARLGYDLDFYMTPQVLFGANANLEFVSAETRVRNVTVAGAIFNYNANQSRCFPTLGFHGTFYPIIRGIALRPNVSSRVDWWDFGSSGTWDWEVSAAVDVPVNRLWTWTVNGGYRYWHLKLKRDRDTIDANPSGLFVETSILF
jgi:hypothetical protein